MNNNTDFNDSFSLQALLGASALAFLVFGGSHHSSTAIERSIPTAFPSTVAAQATKIAAGNDLTFTNSFDIVSPSKMTATSIPASNSILPVTTASLASGYQSGYQSDLGPSNGQPLSLVGGGPKDVVPEPGVTASLVGIIVGVGCTWLRKKK